MCVRVNDSGEFLDEGTCVQASGRQRFVLGTLWCTWNHLWLSYRSMADLVADHRSALNPRAVERVTSSRRAHVMANVVRGTQHSIDFLLPARPSHFSFSRQLFRAEIPVTCEWADHDTQQSP